jgi:uncharacterized phage protein gp47/JayE
LTIDERIQSDIRNRIENPTTFLRRSAFRVLARALAGSHHLQYGYLVFMKDQLFVSTAETDFLEIMGNELGIARKEGSKTQGNVTATGTNGINIASGTRLQSSSGNIYTVDSTVAIAGGTATLAITAEDNGDDYDEAAGTTLTFVTPISGVDSVVTVDSNTLTGGLDDENDTLYRARILDRKRQPPHGGASFDYVKWSKEVSGVTRAWSFPQYNGNGTIGVAFVRDGDTDIIPNETQRQVVRDYIVSHSDPITNITVGCPVTAEPGLLMITLSELALNFSIRLTPNNATVQAAVQSNLADLILQRGGPGETITLSQMYEAIGTATGETSNRILSPTDDVAAPTNRVHVLGTITYQDY